MLATLVLAISATATAYWVETVGTLSDDADDQTVALSVVQVMEGMLAPLAFREPGGTLFGPEAGEALADYDDLDDFHGLVASPPLDAERKPQTGLLGWSATVTVEEVDPVTLEVEPGSVVRRVRIAVERDGRPINESWWLRTRSPFE